MSSNRLAAFAAEKRRAILEVLAKGLPPGEGEYDGQVLKECRAKGKPQMGTTRYEWNAIMLEFIYPDAQSSAAVLVVTIAAPERIVFMPVPNWVVESIWQGEISGGYYFESDAIALVEEFKDELSFEKNPKWFGPQAAKRRE